MGVSRIHIHASMCGYTDAHECICVRLYSGVCTYVYIYIHVFTHACVVVVCHIHMCELGCNKGKS